MKISVFKYEISYTNPIDTDLIESEINDFCEGLTVKDIKVNSYETLQRTSVLVFTIMYF